MIPQPRARKRHEKILDAALRVFAKKGYRDAAVDDIAVESKTSKGGVYFHFPGKQAIFLELLNRTASRLRGKIEEAIAVETDPIARADAALLVVLRTFASHRALARLFMIEALGAGKEFHQRLSEIHEEFATVIKEQLDEAVRQGVIAPLDTQVAATAWFGALNEVVTRWLLTGAPARLQDAYDALRPLLIRSVGVADVVAAVSFEEALGSKLRSALTRAREAAGRSRGAVLACVALPAPSPDLLDVFAASGPNGTYWEQASDRFAMVAVGQASRVAFAGPSRFDGAREQWRRLRQDAIVDAGAAPVEAPVAFSRFAFAPSDGGAGAARPDAVITVPRLLWTRREGSAWLVATVVVSADTDVEAEVAAIEAEVACLIGAPAGAAAPGLVQPCDAGGAERAAWETAVAAAVADLRRGAAEKVVLARSLKLTSAAPIDVVPVLRRLRERFQSCTVFAFQGEDGCFLGATPERLLRVQDGVVTVDCLAGSIGRGADEAEDRTMASKLLHDPKELHEHQVVASAIEEALQPLCTGIDIAPTPRIASFANVHHLFTPISGIAMPGHDVFEFVERLHPTPATGGQPRDAALDLIQKYEIFERGWYAGPVGWVDAAGNGDFAVAIRSGLVSGNEATLYAGSGIMAESDPAREYDETNVKLRAMLWALGQE